jgi:hypothetical protein
MSKRFIDSTLWDKDWYIEIPTKYKILWIYMITKCDTAGIFDPNLKTISKLLNEDYQEQDCLNIFNGKLIKKDNKWLIRNFVIWQYGTKISPKMIDPINKCLERIGLSIDTLSIQYQYSIDTPIEIEKKIELVNTTVKLPLININKIEKNSNMIINDNKILHLEFVKLKPEEHEKLKQRYGEDMTKTMIERLNNYIGSKGVKYKSHYHTILNWANKDGVLDKVSDSGVDQLRKRFGLKKE